MHALRGDVDRIARRAIGRQQFLDLGLNARRQLRHLQPLQRDGVGAQMPAPPDTVSTATRSPFGSGLLVSTAAMVTASSRSLETIKPYLAKTAS